MLQQTAAARERPERQGARNCSKSEIQHFAAEIPCSLPKSLPRHFHAQSASEFSGLQRNSLPTEQGIFGAYPTEQTPTVGIESPSRSAWVVAPRRSPLASGIGPVRRRPRRAAPRPPGWSTGSGAGDAVPTRRSDCRRRTMICCRRTRFSASSDVGASEQPDEQRPAICRRPTSGYRITRFAGQQPDDICDRDTRASCCSNHASSAFRQSPADVRRKSGSFSLQDRRGGQFHAEEIST